MTWWKSDNSSPFCRYLSDSKNRIPCQKHDCLSYIQVHQGDESRFVCRDELDSILKEEGLSYDRAIFQDQERMLKLSRGMIRTQLTGKVDRELTKVAQLETVKKLNNA